MERAFAWRRPARFLGLAAVAACLWLTACAPGGSSSGAPAAQGSSAASQSGTGDIATYRGADRQQRIEEGARREGKLVWYTALIVNQAVRPLVDAFREKYPFVEVETWRGNS